MKITLQNLQAKIDKLKLNLQVIDKDRLKYLTACADDKCSCREQLDFALSEAEDQADYDRLLRLALEDRNWSIVEEVAARRGIHFFRAKAEPSEGLPL